MKLNNIKGIITRFKDLTTLSFANIVGSAIAGIFWFYLASILGTSKYGEVSYLLSIGAIAGVISFLGAGTTITVYTAKKEKIQSTIFFIVIISSIIASLVVFAIVRDYTVSLYIIGYGIFNVGVADILGRKLYSNYSKYLITQKILWVGLSLLFYYTIGSDGIILGFAISFLAYSFVLYRGFKESKISFSSLRPHFGVMMNNYVLDLSRTFSGNIDKIIISPLLGFGLLGNYQLGMQFLSLLVILPNIVFQYILPHDSSGTPNKKLKRVTILLSVVLAVIGIVVSPFVIHHLFPKYVESVRVVQIVSLAIVPTSINLMYISKFLGREQSKIVLIGSGISLGIQIIGILTLGKSIGVNGAAIAVVLAAVAETIYLLVMDRIKFNNKETGSPKNEEIMIVSKSANIIEQKLDFFSRQRHVIISIAVIFSVGLLLRVYYFPNNVPLILDGLQYFFYASDTSLLGHLSTNYWFANNGWPAFLSFFVTIFQFHNFMDYMTLQRVLTVSISTITIIPVYFLCRRFLDKPYAILGAAIFALDPRIIQNSELGITDPLYILLVSVALALFFSNNKKLTYLSFAVTAFASMVRSEGLFVFVPLITLFFILNRKEQKWIAKGVLAASTFILLLLPMVIFRIQNTGNDALVARVLGGASSVKTSLHETGLYHYLATTSSSVIKLSAWSIVPIFIILVPIGFYLILKYRDQQKISLVAIIVSMFLPVIYGFSTAPDTRYIYPLFPVFCIISGYTVKKFVVKFNNKNTILILVMGGILLSSAAFLDIKKIDYDHQRESYSIATKITKVANGVNDFYPEDSYISPAELPQKWPVLSSEIDFKTTIIPTKGFETLDGYIESSRNKGLTHLVVDDNKNRPSFLNTVFYHPEKYPYLEKVFDSAEHGYKYHVKIFKINYQIFDSK